MSRESLRIDVGKAWRPPHAWHRLSVIDAHTGGEPLRVILSGFETMGSTILERRRDAQERSDGLRKALMWEPRGHADMYGCLIVPPETDEAHFGVLFLHNSGFSTMCGHGIIAVVKTVLSTGMLPSEEPHTEVAIDTPAGLVRAQADVRDGEVGEIRFRNVPSFVQTLDAKVDVPGLGSVHYDLAFGGAFYAFVDAESIGLRCEPAFAERLITAGRAIKAAVADREPVTHPFEADLSFLYGVIFTGESSVSGGRHVCIFADGELDRSPTGTGVSARLALMHARGQLSVGASTTIDSILGSPFTGKVLETTDFGGLPAVVPEVGGHAWLTGRQELWLDPKDPLREGFFLR